MSDRMRTIRRMTVVLLALGAWAAVASASPVTFDENGHGTWSDGTPLQWYIGPDPGPGGMPNAFFYQNGPHEIGDLLIEEPDGTVSDVVRFGVDGMIVFYSELPEAGEVPDLADIGLPSDYFPNQSVVAEQGLEGFNWADYAPGPGMPGYVADQPDLTYHIISDVPEPASLSLLVLGGLVLIRRRR